LFHLELASRGIDSADSLKYERCLRELLHLLNTWGDLLDSGDPFYSPNILFGWDFCEVPSTPRRDKPWWNYFTEQGLNLKSLQTVEASFKFTKPGFRKVFRL
jgi:hypothetical protein